MSDDVLLCAGRDGVGTLSLTRPERRADIARGERIQAGRAEALADEARTQPGNFATADAGEAYAAFAATRDVRR